MITQEELDRFESEDIEKAERHMIDICKDLRNFNMSIPPQRDDTDILMFRVFTKFRGLEAENKKLKEKIKEFIHNGS